LFVLAFVARASCATVHTPPATVCCTKYPVAPANLSCETRADDEKRRSCDPFAPTHFTVATAGGNLSSSCLVGLRPNRDSNASAHSGGGGGAQVDVGTEDTVLSRVDSSSPLASGPPAPKEGRAGEGKVLYKEFPALASGDTSTM
jgi:hypothetical protein